LASSLQCFMTFLELAAVCAIGYLASEIYDSSRVAAACATCFFAYKFYALLVVAASCRRALFVVYRRIGASVIPASRGAGFLRHVARLGAGYSSGVIGDGPPEALRRWLTPTSAAATVLATARAAESCARAIGRARACYGTAREHFDGGRGACARRAAGAACGEQPAARSAAAVAR
jgi:hypothetical protein